VALSHSQRSSFLRKGGGEAENRFTREEVLITQLLETGNKLHRFIAIAVNHWAFSNIIGSEGTKRQDLRLKKAYEASVGSTPPQSFGWTLIGTLE